MASKDKGEFPVNRARKTVSLRQATVMTVNLRFGLADDGPNSWANRKNGFYSLFYEIQPDFIGCQEANDFQIDFLGEVLPGYRLIGKRHPAPPFWQNNVIFYRSSWQCRAHDHFFLSPTPDLPSRSRNSRWPRQCTMGLFERSDCQMVCINTHFDFESSVQVDSAHMILDRTRQFPRHVPTVLVGDFNAAPDSPCYRVFTTGNREAAADPFLHVCKAPFPGTFHGFTGARNGQHIDWILYRGNLTLLSSKIIDRTFEGQYLSDHFPVTATFALSRNREARKNPSD